MFQCSALRAILISGKKIEYKTKIAGNKEGRSNGKRVKSSRIWNNLYIYSPNTKAWKYEKQKLAELMAEIHTSVIIVGDVNTPLSMDKTTRQNQQVNKRLQQH